MKKSSRIFLLISLFLFLFVFVFSVYKLASYYSRRQEETKYVRLLTDQFEVVIPPDKDDICPIKIDFDSLKKKNPDVVAWIYSEGLSLNYPIVKGKDNSEYLHRSVDKTYLYSGTLFVDSYNTGKFTDLNTVIYGHNMQNGTMFHQIVKYKKQAFYDENIPIWLLTPDQNYKLEPVSGRIVKSNDEAYRIYKDKDSFYDYFYESLESSTFKSKVDLATVEKVVTLSTCTYEFRNARYVLVCKMTECY